VAGAGADEKAGADEEAGAGAVAPAGAGLDAAGVIDEALADAAAGGRVAGLLAPGVACRGGTVATAGAAATARPAGLVAGEATGAGLAALEEDEAPQPPAKSTASTSAPGSKNLT